MFKQKKNKQFNYKPRFSADEITPEKKGSPKGWDISRAESRQKRKTSKLPFLLVVLILICIVMYYLETKL